MQQNPINPNRINDLSRFLNPFFFAGRAVSLAFIRNLKLKTTNRITTAETIKK